MTRLRLSRLMILPVLLTMAALAAGCGSSSESGSADGPTAADGPPAPGPGDLVQTDGAAGTLVPMPDVVAPGDVLVVRVDNQGDARLDYGLANRVDRYVDGEWTEATAEVYEGGPPAFIEILLTLDPGKEGRPEDVPLSQDVELGTYRVVKEVFVQGGTVPEMLTLEAIFEVQA